jgi:hypothetical protein
LSTHPRIPARTGLNRSALSVVLFPRERIADMLRERCSGVSQSIRAEYSVRVGRAPRTPDPAPRFCRLVLRLPIRSKEERVNEKLITVGCWYPRSGCPGILGRIFQYGERDFRIELDFGEHLADGEPFERRKLLVKGSDPSLDSAQRSADTVVRKYFSVRDEPVNWVDEFPQSRKLR